MNQNYIKESSDRALNNRKEFHISGECNLYLIDKLPEHLNVKNIVAEIRKSLPEDLFYGLDAIYIGDYKELTARNVESVYYSGAVYVKPNQKSESDIISDIVHEIAHSVEENYSHYFLSTNLQNEFLAKRKQLYKILNGLGFTRPIKFFMNPNYSEEFDKFLSEEVGYERLNSVTSNMFVSPYAATSIREYFANGFEFFFYKHRLSNVPVNVMFENCPHLYSLLKELTSPE
jgi:hypothetical protein